VCRHPDSSNIWGHEDEIVELTTGSNRLLSSIHVCFSAEKCCWILRSVFFQRSGLYYLSFLSDHVMIPPILWRCQSSCSDDYKLSPSYFPSLPSSNFEIRRISTNCVIIWCRQYWLDIAVGENFEASEDEPASVRSKLQYEFGPGPVRRGRKTRIFLGDYCRLLRYTDYKTDVSINF